METPTRVLKPICFSCSKEKMKTESTGVAGNLAEVESANYREIVLFNQLSFLAIV